MPGGWDGCPWHSSPVPSHSLPLIPLNQLADLLVLLLDPIALLKYLLLQSLVLLQQSPA